MVKYNEMEDLETILKYSLNLEGKRIRTPKEVYHTRGLHLCWGGSGCRRWCRKCIHCSEAQNMKNCHPEKEENWSLGTGHFEKLRLTPG